MIDFETKFKSEFVKGIIKKGLGVSIIDGKLTFPTLSNSSVGVNKNVEDTELFKAYAINATSMQYSLPDDAPARLISSFFAATSTYLSRAKVADTEYATVLILPDTSGVIKFAGIVEYHEGESADEPGNWSYVLTFNPEDVEAIEKTKKVKKIMYTDDAFKSIFDKVSYDIAGFTFGHERYMYDACILCTDTIVQILDAEAIENQVVDIEFEGYFTASVAIEDNEKVFSITPHGNMKEIIKSDIDLDR